VQWLAIDAGAQLAAVGLNGYPQEGLGLVDLSTGAQRWRVDWKFSTYDCVAALAFGSGGERVWIVLGDGRLRCFAVADGRMLEERGSPAGSASVEAVHLLRDASYAVVSTSLDETPGWSAFTATITTADELIAVEGPPLKGDTRAHVQAIIASSPVVRRVDDVMRLAYSPDGTLELVSYSQKGKPLRLEIVRRTDKSVLDSLTFTGKGDRPISGFFSDDSARFWIGTWSGSIFACAIDNAR
jgi:hypothetical protein